MRCRLNVTSRLAKLLPFNFAKNLSDNARGDTAFYTMLDPFAYLSATQALDKKPLEYAAGDTFSLSYLLAVYSANKTREFIQGRCERWEKERN